MQQSFPLRILLLSTGLIILLLHLLFPFPAPVQVWFFVAGVLLLGIPHGAADLLVGAQNARPSRAPFRTSVFLLQYLLRLAAFALLFYLLPSLALGLFILLAAFHFGETDLQPFDTATLKGKVFIISYGLLVLGSILLVHLEEAQPLLLALGIEANDILLLEWMAENRSSLIYLLLFSFFAGSFIFFLQTPLPKGTDSFLLQLSLKLILLFCLPLLLGFTFYFVIWHSALSLSNIVAYLRKGKVSLRSIAITISLYSSIAIGGVMLLGMISMTLTETRTLVALFFLALAVLTAPHMEIMHEMYKQARKKSASLPQQTPPRLI